MRQRWSNNARTNLSLNIDPSSTSILVDDGSMFTPLSEGEFEVITLSAGATTEIIHVVSRVGSNWTVQRAQEGTTALNWASGTPVESRVTAGSLGRLSQIEFDPAEIPSLLVSTSSPVQSFGPGSVVTSGSGVSIGSGCDSSNDGVSFGKSSNASGNNSVAIGSSSNSIGTDSVSVGVGNSASQSFSVSVGRGNDSSGNESVSIGVGNSASQSFSVSVGRGNGSSGNESVSIGVTNSVTAQSASAFGTSNRVSGELSLAVGWGNISSNLGAVSLGVTNTSSGEGSISLGHYNISSETNSVAIGGNSEANGPDSISIGTMSFAEFAGCIAMGRDSKVAGVSQFNMTTIPTAQPSESLGTRDAALFLSTQPTIIFTPIIDLKISQFVFSMNLPSGMSFFVDEIGFVGKYVNTVTVKPIVRIGNIGNNSLFLDAAEITEATSGSRFIFPAIVGRNISTQMFRVEVITNAGALEYNGQFYFRGFAMAV